MVDELHAELSSIERDLDGGSYRPGPWQALLRRARKLPDADRAQLADDVSRISDKLHRRGGHKSVTFNTGLALEGIATLIGLALLAAGLHTSSNLLAILAALILTATLQPLVKIAVGTGVGISYSYVYILGYEPRFKMRYGSYLAAPRWARIVLHLSGMIGSPLALWVVKGLAAPDLTVAWALCTIAFWLVNAINLILLLFGFAGIPRLPFGLSRVPVWQTSGGVAGSELREVLDA
jgi:hypothetical protein